MHIHLVHYEWPNVTPCGGSGQIARQLRRCLQDRGHTVTLTTDTSNRDFVSYPLRSYLHLRRRVRLEQPDVLFGHSTLPTSMFLPRIAGEVGVPFVVKAMGSDIYNPASYRRLRPVLTLMNRYIVRRADRFVCPSEALARRSPTRRWTVIPNGIDPAEWSWQPNRLGESVNVLSVGRLEPVKQIDVGIRAVGMARLQGLDARYRVVGDGSQRSVLESRHGNLEWVSFTGWQDDVSDAYRWADVLLVPSAWESFGLVVLEAVASGVPVVASDTGGHADILRDATSCEQPIGCVAKDTPSELARALTRLADGYQEYQANTESFVERYYTLDEMVDRYEALFRRVAGSMEPRSVPDERDDERNRGASDPRNRIPYIERQ